MKKMLKIAGIVLGGLLAVILLLVAWISFTPKPTFEEVEIPPLTVSKTAADIQHGRKLVMQDCYDCHFNAETGTLSGSFFGENPLASAFTANITRDEEAGIGAYSEGELYRLLRTGVKRNHELLQPFMPRLALMSDEDLHDIIAFLKSDDPLLAPSKAVRPIELSVLGKALTKFAFRPIAYSESYLSIPAVDNQVAYGEYLVNARLLCFGCHSNTHEVNLSDPPMTPGYLGGGTEFGPGLVSPSLHRDAQGIGKWSEGDFVRTLTTGVNPDGDTLRLPMRAYSDLDTAEITAIWAYLGTVKPVEVAAAE